MMHKEHFLNELEEIKQKNKMALVTIGMGDEEHRFPYTPDMINETIEFFDSRFENDLFMKSNNDVRIIELDEV